MSVLPPLISIIVPVYNVEKYLRRCVDSILAQTLADFECVLVDDGSTDNSPAICDEYAARDNRVVVIHRENAGVSSARNAGIDAARGQWIGFVDSDDWLDPGMYQALYGKAVKSGADISMCTYREVEVTSGETRVFESPGEMILDDCDEAIRLGFTCRAICTAVWNKLSNAAIFKERGARFDTEIKTMEDAACFYDMVKHAKRVVFFPLACYNYLVNPMSKSRRSQLTRTSALTAYDKMLSGENSAALRKVIFLEKIDFAARACYDEIERHRDKRWRVFARIVRANMASVLRLPGRSLKARLSFCACVLCPGLSCLRRRIKNRGTRRDTRLD